MATGFIPLTTAEHKPLAVETTLFAKHVNDTESSRIYSALSPCLPAMPVALPSTSNGYQQLSSFLNKTNIRPNQSSAFHHYQTLYLKNHYNYSGAAEIYSNWCLD